MSNTQSQIKPTHELNRVLREYARGTSCDLESEPEVFRGFSGATVYRIRTESGAFALRHWGAGGETVPRKRRLGLHRLLQWIRDNGVPQTAAPLTTSAGSTLVRVPSGDWQLEPWMPGVADFWQKPGENRIRHAVRALAEWHRAARTFVPNDSEREWFRCETQSTSPAVRERLQKILKWQRGRLARLRRILESPEREIQPEMHGFARFVARRFEETGSAIASELQKALEFPVNLQPCLRDVWHDHVLFTGDDVTGLIDASACRTESVSADLSRLLGSFFGDDQLPWQFALESYCEITNLSETEFRLTQVLDRSSVLLSGLTWLDRYFFRKQTFANWDAVVKRLGRISQRLETLS